MIAVVAAAAVTLQALLATWPSSPIPSAPEPEHHAHHAAHHAGHDGHAADPSGPPSGAPDHHKFCCILGSKLGTAIGPAPASVSLPARLEDVILAHAPGTDVALVFRPPLRPLGARAPPLLG
jgi:hypothetical protein